MWPKGLSIAEEGKMENLARILAAHPFFKGLESKYIDLLVSCAANVRFDPGTFIFREGGEANQFFIIREGEIALEIHCEGREPITVQTLKQGEVLGWGWLVPPYRWHQDAQAVQLTRAFAFDGKCLRTKCQEDKNLGYELLIRVLPLMGRGLEATQLKFLEVFKKND
jgi:CRP-like cAMP-binding protein